MKNKKLVIFDLDGTLLDTSIDLKEAVNYSLNCFGYESLDEATITSYLGNGLKELMRLSIPGNEKNVNFEKSYSLLVEYYMSHYNIYTKPYDGIINMLKTLENQGTKLAIISNKRHEATVDLTKIFFDDYIQVVYGENLENGIPKKPNPYLCNLVIKHFNVNKQDVVYIGDSEVDYYTAKEAGIDSVLVTYGFRNRKFLEILPNTVLVDNNEELSNLLKK